MLGRTAASLFWMSRYQERAQNIAKLLEVAYRTDMMPSNGINEAGDWRFALQASGVDFGYSEKIGEITPRGAINYMIFDKDNPSSVRVCLENARNNGRAVRTGITSEIWESLNTTYLEFIDVNPQSITQDKLPDFLAWISQRAHLFRGALLNTILRDDGYYFSQLGNFVERADNTARILDTQYWLLLPDNDVIGDGSMERQQWTGILRALSGLRSYRFAYPNAKLKATNIAEFLILRKEMPRSLAYCCDWIDDTTDDLAQFYGERMPSIEMAENNWKAMRSTSIEDVYRRGLHDYLLEFMSRNNSFAMQLSEDYNFS